VLQTTNLSLKENWKEVFKSPFERAVLLSGWLLIIAIIYVLPIFFNNIEKRKGIVLHDWLLAAIPGHNFSILIFSIIWGMALLTLYRAVYNPSVFLIYLWTLIFVTITRMITISLVPLDPPIGLIPLTDPVNEIFYGHSMITKDLFFSGHTATLFLFYLCLDKKQDKLLALIAVIVLCVLLLIQHIHYTIDILAAPIVVYGFYRLTRFILGNYQ
jgi:hypothetical protein